MSDKDLTQLSAILQNDLHLDDSPAAPRSTQDLQDLGYDGPGGVIADYLIARVPEFARLSTLRKKGWENPAGDDFFRKQRQTADNADQRESRAFYEMMRHIGRELHQYTQAFKIRTPGAGQKRILDMCMAPGGFLATALEKNPDAHALGFSLPTSHGGHASFLPTNPNVELRFLDITMLAEDMGAVGIPAEHPDADNFLPRQLHPDDKFHLVFCDGQVLRPHDKFRAGYRDGCEARRLTATQLAIGLGHLRTGGTMVVLMHKVESWRTVLLLREFGGFSRVKLHKPLRSHTKRSSFYMVASNVRSQSAEALEAIEAWKEVWRAATFDDDDDEETRWGQQRLDPRDILEDFGEELVRLGRRVWETQADALEHASFIKDHNK